MNIKSSYEQSTFFARIERQYLKRNGLYFKTRAMSCVKKFFRKCELCSEPVSWHCKHFYKIRQIEL